MIVKLFGLKESGIDYLAWLLNENFKNITILRSHTGWEHGELILTYESDYTKWKCNDLTDPMLSSEKEKEALSFNTENLNSGKPLSYYVEEIKSLYDTGELPLLIVLRNPYIWLHEYCVKNFKDGEYRILERAMRMWNGINRDYIDMPWSQQHYIKYEKLVSNSEIELQRMSDFLGVGIAGDIKTNPNILNTTINTTQLIKEICEHEGITEEIFQTMFDDIIEKRILDWYIKL